MKTDDQTSKHDCEEEQTTTEKEKVKKKTVK